MRRWQELSRDPNDPGVMAARRDAIAKARSNVVVRDRVAYLCNLVERRHVLDVGVVEHTGEAKQSPQWLHGHLTRCAASCVGVDVIEQEVRDLNKQGYDVVFADITRAPLDQKFEVIVAGEVLEHLDAPGMFMEHCAAMLDTGGRLVITVPNPWYVNAIVKSCLKRYTFVDSADHVAWYDAATLFELAQRHGFELERFTAIIVDNPHRLGAKLFFTLRPFLVAFGLAPQLFAKSIIYEFVRT
jgi:2-polyprenyl-3-methyl-5-hydroxy-6-metoxy-1,4-benzoquinol methylase